VAVVGLVLALAGAVVISIAQETAKEQTEDGRPTGESSPATA
jgi:hypothetical protein